LLQLPAEIKDYVSRGTLSMGHARAIITITDPKVQKELAKKAIEENWSVRQLEEVVQNLQAKKKPAAKVNKGKKRDPFISSVEEELREILQTTVKVKHERNKGKIEIAYYSMEDFDRLLDLLKRKEA
jgi:ParB family chromosome partitioning protein